MKKKKIAFVCSGGGVAAIESIGGMMDALKDIHEITPNKVWACSGGAIPSALYFKNVRIPELYNKYKVNEIMKPRSMIDILKGKSLMDNTNLKILLEELVGYKFNKDLIVNVTEKSTKITHYVYGNCITVLTSAAFPEVLPPQYLVADGWRLNSFESGNEVRKIEVTPTTLESVECYDGGVYDVIPVPTKLERNKYDKIYILVSSQSSYDVTKNNRIQNAINLMMSTMEREYHEILKTYSYDDNVVILRPPMIEGSLFDWSKDNQCYTNAYNYIKSIKL